MSAATRLAILTTPLLGLAVIPPRLEAGTECTQQYAKCIAESGLLPSPFKEMGDVECGAEYVACVAKKLKFW